MTNSIEIPNFTQIPNVVLDYWIDKLTNAEFKVLVFLCRKTFGWHKKSDNISRSQIALGTNIADKSVRRILKVLEFHNLVKITQNSSKFGDQPNTYELVIQEQLVIQKQTEGGVMRTPTKETLQKEEEERANAPQEFLKMAKNIEKNTNSAISSIEALDLISDYGPNLMREVWPIFYEKHWSTNKKKIKFPIAVFRKVIKKYIIFKKAMEDVND